MLDWLLSSSTPGHKHSPRWARATIPAACLSPEFKRLSIHLFGNDFFIYLCIHSIIVSNVLICIAFMQSFTGFLIYLSIHRWPHYLQLYLFSSIQFHLFVESFMQCTCMYSFKHPSIQTFNHSSMHAFLHQLMNGACIHTLMHRSTIQSLRQVQGYLAHKKHPPPRITIGP